MDHILAQSASYDLGHEYESCFLLHKPTGKQLHVGEHYGDPSAGLIAPDETWCLTAGHGLILYEMTGETWVGFREPFQDGPERALTFSAPADQTWLAQFTADRGQFVETIALEPPTSVLIKLDPQSDDASTWQLDIPAKSIRRVR